MKSGTQRKTLPCSALVTRYPSGCFGIDYQGSMFFWWGFGEKNVHAELERLRIPAPLVEWQERYYDSRYDCNDPRSYKTRKFIPHMERMFSPPDGFRMLIDGERTKRGDVFFMFGKWLPAKGYNAKWNSRQYWPMARQANSGISKPL